MRKISIVILNFNGCEDTLECLTSLCGIDYALLSIILIDNASTDNSVEIISKKFSKKYLVTNYKAVDLEKGSVAFAISYNNRDAGEVSELAIIQNSENIGFAAGCNQGIALALSEGAEFIWLLNNDTVVEPESLSIMARYLDGHTACQVVSPQIRLHDEPDRIWNCGGQLKWYGTQKYFYIHKFVEELPLEKEILNITFVTGCAPLICSRLLQDHGGFTEKFFFGEEDYDFSLRMKKAGIQMVCCLESIIYHKVGASIDRASSNYDIRKAYVHYLNRFINLRTWWPRFFWQGWRFFYVLYIYLLLAKRSKSERLVCLAFVRRLLKDSSIMEGVDKKTFLKILNPHADYFHQS